MVRKDVPADTERPTSRPGQTWIDEGPVASGSKIRARASDAVRRGRAQRGQSRTQADVSDIPTRMGSSVPKAKAPVPTEIVSEVARVADRKRVDALSSKLNSARVALDRERYAEAKRIARSLVKELGRMASVHEIIGLASYRLGQWRDAVTALEIARSLDDRVENLPVLADCYRAQRRWQEVDQIWKDLKEQSPVPEIMAEGRIVMAGSLAERGDVKGAIELMRKSASVPRRIREYHLRQWYVLADLYDRAGDIQRAREVFVRIASADPEFADVRERLAGL